MPGRKAIAIAILLGLAGSYAGLAQDRGRPREQSVRITVLAIRATRSNKEISPQLRPLAGKLKGLGYTGFKLERQTSGSAAVNGSFSAALVGGYTANVTPREVAARRVKLQVQVLKGRESISNATTTAGAGQYVLYMVPFAGEDKLIVAVAAQ